MPTRREVLQLSAVGGLGLAAPAAGRVRASLFARTTFEGALGTSFAVLDGAPLTLVAVDPGPFDPRVDNFRLSFTSSSSAFGRHELRHPDLGRFTLHLESSRQTGCVAHVAAFRA